MSDSPTIDELTNTSLMLYKTLTLTPYVTPIDLGLTPPYLHGNLILAVRQTIADDHKVKCYTFVSHSNMDDVLKSLILAFIDDLYTTEKSNKYTGYLGVTMRDLIDHLIMWYRKITSADLDDKNSHGGRLQCITAHWCIF